MNFVKVEAFPIRGRFEIELPEAFIGKIGLLEFSLPCINHREIPNNYVEITCDQLDPTLNPKRIFKRLFYPRTQVTNQANFWEAKIIEYHDVNTSDKFLSFKIDRLNGPISFHRNVKDHRIFATIVFVDESEKEKWTYV